MPSIAQQDYIVIAPKVGNTIDIDAYALGQLAKILEKKDTSILDVILELVRNQEYSKIVSYATTVNSVGYVAHTSKEVKEIDILYTSTQYEGLAAVQEAGVELEGEDSILKNMLPILKKNSDGYFSDDAAGYLITDTEGHKISVTVADGKLATVAISDEVDEGGTLKVPFEDIQKLIGLPM